MNEADNGTCTPIARYASEEAAAQKEDTTCIPIARHANEEAAAQKEDTTCIPIARHASEEAITMEEYMRRKRTVFRTCTLSQPMLLNSKTEHNVPLVLPIEESKEGDSTSLLLALRQEAGIKKPEELYKNCCETVKTLKEHGILKGYIINDEEAATLCAVSSLLKTGFGFEEMFERCTKMPPSALVLVVLKALRKLPRYIDVLYFCGEMANRVEEKLFVSCVFSPSSRSMNFVKDGLDESKTNEIFRVEECWGYDISDFSLSKDDVAKYCKQINKYNGKATTIFINHFFFFSFFSFHLHFTATRTKGELVVMEPWRSFKVLDPGVIKDNVSIVPLKMLDQGLIYEKEIPPGVSRHIIKELKLNLGSEETRVRLLTNLLSLPFNSKCTFLFFSL